MKQYQAIALNPGLFSAPLFVVNPRESLPSGFPGEPDSVDEKMRLLDMSLEQSISELNRLAADARSPEAKDILEAQAMMLEDSDFQSDIKDKIVQDGLGVFQALLESSEAFAGLFLAMDDPVFKSKAQDIRDVSSRTMQHLQSLLGGDSAGDSFCLPQGAALFFERLLPSQFTEVEQAGPAGILVREGSGRSHLAILCAEAGIPLFACPDFEPVSEWNGLKICAYEDGRLFIDPDAEQIRLFAEAEKRAAGERADAATGTGAGDGAHATVHEPLRYQGEKVELLLNIDGGYFSRHPEARFDCDGIGLLRSEFSYIGRDDLPTEDELFEEYKNAVLAMDGRRCVIRTLDLGSDKQARCLPRAEEPNPALGIRGIRFSLLQPALFRTQLRAIYRASAFGPLAMMFPMVCSVEEIRQAKAIAAEVREELSRQDCPFEAIRIGIMVETPAAALLCGEWAEEADFFCVGSNDLTQYTLAADRENTTLGNTLNEFHPAVQLLLRRVAETARAHHKELSLCGELARYPEALQSLLTWGYRRFSVSAVHLSGLRERLRNEVHICSYLEAV